MTVRVYNYLILMAESRKELVEKIRLKLEDGWEPQGGVSFQPEEKKYMQAIVQRQN